MNAIAAAVIGGTSLFGGRGRTWNALLGVPAIVSIQYGLALQGIASPIQYMITGGVLLATVVIDAVIRKTQKMAVARSGSREAADRLRPVAQFPAPRAPPQLLRTCARRQWRCRAQSCPGGTLDSTGPGKARTAHPQRRYGCRC